MVVGMDLGQLGSSERAGKGETIAKTIAKRLAIRSRLVELDGSPAIAGEWTLDAVPAFDPSDGRFCGYRGQFRRTSAKAAPKDENEAAERARQVLHELRTPVNAIQGFAEVIQQQLFGPAPHRYRALAATIAGDSARILSAFDELERLARLDSGVMAIEHGACDVADLAKTIATHLQPTLKARGGNIVIAESDELLPVAIASDEVERMLWRLLTACASMLHQGEELRLKLERQHDTVTVSLTLPDRLGSGSDLFRMIGEIDDDPLSPSILGVGFALRLVAAEARAGGGELKANGSHIALHLPLMSHSHEAVPRLTLKLDGPYLPTIRVAARRAVDARWCGPVAQLVRAGRS